MAFSRYQLPDKALFGGDEWEYQSMAVNFATGHGLKFGGILPFNEYAFDTSRSTPEYYAQFEEAGKQGGTYDFYRTPGYPFVLGLIYKVFGVRPHVAIAMQVLWVAAVSALLPILGRTLLGWRGFIAGVVGGAVFFVGAVRNVQELMTEGLIIVACFGVTWAWAYVCRRPSSRIAPALLGLSLAAALLVKGSLIFLPPLFLGYMVLRTLTDRTYRLTAILTVLLFLAAPLACYSAYATQRAHSFIVLSTQTNVVLLDGNNELMRQDGFWHPEWRDNPASFYNQLSRKSPELSPTAMVARFYWAHPGDLPRILANKLAFAAGGGTRTARLMWLFMGLMILSIGVSLSEATMTRPVWRYATAFGLLAIVFLLNNSFVTLFLLFLALAAMGCLIRPVRSQFAAVWRNPDLMGLVLIPVNFLLLTLVTFGYNRYVMPGNFVLALLTGYMAIRLAERLLFVENLPRESIIARLFSQLRRTA